MAAKLLALPIAAEELTLSLLHASIGATDIFSRFDINQLKERVGGKRSTLFNAISLDRELVQAAKRVKAGEALSLVVLLRDASPPAAAEPPAGAPAPTAPVRDSSPCPAAHPVGPSTGVNKKRKLPLTVDGKPLNDAPLARPHGLNSDFPLLDPEASTVLYVLIGGRTRERGGGGGGGEWEGHAVACTLPIRDTAPVPRRTHCQRHW